MNRLLKDSKVEVKCGTEIREGGGGGLFLALSVGCNITAELRSQWPRFGWFSVAFVIVSFFVLVFFFLSFFDHSLLGQVRFVFTSGGVNGVCLRSRLWWSLWRSDPSHLQLAIYWQSSGTVGN